MKLAHSVLVVYCHSGLVYCHSGLVYCHSGLVYCHSGLVYCPPIFYAMGLKYLYAFHCIKVMVFARVGYYPLFYFVYTWIISV